MKCDVAIVGAGPAGSTAARVAAEAGLDVVLLEKRQEIGEPVRCAEGVTINSELKDLIELKPEWICNRIQGAKLYVPDGSSMIIRDEKGHEGYILERRIFDRSLAIEAALAGARTLVKTHATGLLRDRSHRSSITTVSALSLGEPLQINASLVIGADGVESKVAAWAGIGGALKPEDIMVCAQFLVMEAGLDQDYCQFFFGNNVAPGGYVWIFPKGRSLANVGIGIQGSQSASGAALNMLNTFLADHMPEAKILQIVTGGIPTSGPVKTAISDGVMLVGDAAHQSDPLTGGGIINAIRAGKIAGEVAAKAISSGDVSRKALAEYDQRWKASLGNEIEKAHQTKKFFQKLSDDDLNRLSDSLQGKNISSMGNKDILKFLFKLNPRMLWSIKSILL